MRGISELEATMRTNVSWLVSALGVGILVVYLGTTLFTGRVAAANPSDVRVVNTPLPVQGTVDVQGTVGATQSGTWSVGVRNTTDINGVPVPLTVRDGQSFQFNAVAQFANGDTQVVVNLGTVPNDREYIVDFVSAEANFPSGQRVFLTFFDGQGQSFFAPTLVGSDTPNDILVLSQPARLSLVSTPRITATRFSGNSGPGFVALHVSGHIL
jgi:hypothetical protein